MKDGAIVAWPSGDTEGYYWQLLSAVGKHYDIPLTVPVSKLNKAQIKILLYGSGEESIKIKYKNREGAVRVYETKYEGIINNLRRRYRESTSDYIRGKIDEYMIDRPCDTCGGSRLNAVARSVTCLLYTSPSPRDLSTSRMPSSA